MPERSCACGDSEMVIPAEAAGFRESPPGVLIGTAVPAHKLPAASADPLKEERSLAAWWVRAEKLRESPLKRAGAKITTRIEGGRPSRCQVAILEEARGSVRQRHPHQQAVERIFVTSTQSLFPTNTPCFHAGNIVRGYARGYGNKKGPRR